MKETDSTIPLTAVPRLAGFVRLERDHARERWVLQAPERVLVLDESGRAIVERCDGRTSVEEIVAALAAKYQAPPGVIGHDVCAFLGVLADKQFLLIEAHDGR